MTDTIDTTEKNPAVARMSRDLVKAAQTMSADEARYLVDTYYITQEDRKRAANQSRAMAAEPHTVIAWLREQDQVLEGQIKRALDSYTDAQEIGVWMKSIYGIGPVIAAGLLAHIDINKAPTVGHIWRYAGLDPTMKWEKGQKRPWNASLKTLCWKIGQSFLKASGKEECFYGQVYKHRKEYEIRRNDSGANAATAAELLPKFKKTTEAYKHLETGKLPPAQIDARARRYAVKLFLSHVQMVWFWLVNKRLPVKPYIIEHGGHVHMIVPPNMPVEMAAAVKKLYPGIS